MTNFNRGEIDQGVSFLETRELQLLKIERELNLLGKDVTSLFPKVLEGPFKMREVEARALKAVKSVGNLLGALTACSRQLGAQRDGAETGLFDGQVRPVDDLEATGLPQEVIDVAQTFVDNVRAELGGDEAVTITAGEKSILITVKAVTVIEDSIEGVASFVGEITEILGEGTVIVEGASVMITNPEPAPDTSDDPEPQEPEEGGA